MPARSTVVAGPLVAPRLPFWSLLRLTLDNTFGLTAARQRYLVRRERLWEPALILFSLLASGGFFVFFLYQVARAFVASGAQVGQPEIAFTFTILVVSGLVFFFGLMAVISVFYFSNDLEILIPLPLRPGSIVLAKFGAILAGEYIGVLAGVGPTAIAYAQAMGGGLLYWLTVVVVMALLPVIPLAVASVFSLVVMRVINRRHRDLLIVLFSLALVTVMLVFQMSVMNNVPQEPPADYLQKLLSGRISLVNMLGRGYPPAAWATRGIAAADLGPRLLSLTALIGATLIAIWVMGFIGQTVFYGGVVGGEELARRRLTAEQTARARARTVARTAQGSVLRALFWREWRLFMRVPLFVMNGFLASLIVPVIFVFGYRGLLRDAEVQAFFRAIDASGNAPFFMALGVAALAVLLVALNTTASSAISREGKYFWVSKVIPVAPERQLQGKLLFSLVAALVSAVPVLLIFDLAFSMTPARFVGMSVLALLASALSLLIGLLVDLARPFLKWTNPQQAVKSNLNIIIPLPITLALLAGLGFAAVRLHRGLGLGEVPTMSVLAAVLVALIWPAYLAAVSAARRLYGRLEP